MESRVCSLRGLGFRIWGLFVLVWNVIPNGQAHDKGHGNSGFRVHLLVVVREWRNAKQCGIQNQINPLEQNHMYIYIYIHRGIAVIT